MMCLNVMAQEEHMVPKDKWSKALYISDEFCATKGLEPGETNGLIRVWNNLKENAKYSRLVDIRWYFSSDKEAADYLSKNIKDLSEKGEEVKPTVSIPFASNLRVFREGPDMKKLNDALGLKMDMYFFLFTEKNYLVKVFVSSEKDITQADAAIFAVEAAKRLHATIQ